MIPAAPYPAFDDTAACKRVDPELFFPTIEGNSNAVRDAKKLCKGTGKDDACPFLDACREWAINTKEQGIWGGTTNKERDRIRKKRGITAKPVVVRVALPSKAKHGGSGGATAHYRAKEKPCDACRLFANARKRATRKSRAKAAS